MNVSIEPRKRSLTALVLASALALTTVACATTQPAGQQLSDSAITSKVKAKLAADPQVNPFNIDVDTLDGKVVLRGEVEKDVARVEAEKLALATAGVASVDNRIEVVSAAEEDDSVLSDAAITAKVKAKLAADPQVNPFNIDVDTRDGRVTLSGKVKTETAVEQAAQLAASTAGVASVENDLQVVEKVSVEEATD